MPDEWAILADDLKALIDSGAGNLNLSEAAIKRAKITAEHSEGLALMRMKNELGSLQGLDIDLATAGHHVCGHCLNPTDGGLLTIAKLLGIQKLTIRSAKGFDDDHLSGIIEIVNGIIQ